MRWVDVVWSMFAATSLTLGLIQLSVWIRRRQRRAHGLFALAAISVATFTLIELAALRATTPAELETVYRWAHLPIVVLVLSIVAYVHVRIGTGRLYIGVAACALRVIALALNFTTGANLNFTEITRLHPVAWWGGEAVVYGEGIANPFVIVAVASNLLLLVYLADTWVRAEREPNAEFRRRARIICIGWIAFVLTMAASALLMSINELHMPFLGSLGFVLVVGATSFELSYDVQRSTELADRLIATQRDLALAVRAGGVTMWTWDPGKRDTPGRFTLWDVDEGHAEALSEKRFFARVHPDDREGLHRALQGALTHRTPLEYEHRLEGNGGADRWVALRAGFEPDGGDRLRGVEQDITERREIAAQREKLARLTRVTMLGELSASLAHELNQPLAAILANTQAAQRLLEREPMDVAEIRDILGDIVEDNHRAGRVIIGLRGLFRDAPVQHETLDVNAIVVSVVRLLRSYLTTHAAEVRVELAPELPPLEGDRVQLEQVLLNLVVNACEAMEGQREPRVLTIRTEASGDQVHIRVADTGRGIPVDDLLRIFESFVTTREGGLGLGLSVCRTILRAHGGRIWAMNNEGRGATFSVQLPTRSLAAQERAGEGSTTPPAPTTP